VPGLLLPVLGLPSLPPYPLQVASTHPNAPNEAVDLPLLNMRASSSADSSTAAARTGAASVAAASIGNISASARAGVDRELQEVVADAESSVEVLSVIGVLNLGSAHSTASATRRADGELSTSAGFVVDGLRVAGMAIGVSDEGLLLPGSATPVPSSEGLNPILDQTGLVIEFLAEEEIDDGIMSAGLSIRMPAPTILEEDEGSFQLTIGRTIATATASALGAGLEGEGFAEGGVTEPPDPAPTSPPPPVPDAGTPVDLGAAPAPAPSSPGGSGAPSDSERPVFGVPAAPAPIATVQTASFYLMLVGGGFAAFLSSLFLRKFGVKLAWTG
jgi:hypothetical protein